MLPAFILPQISSNACKTYLVLHAHLDPRAPAPVVQLPMTDLMRLTGFSSRTCANALRELCRLHLLRRLPFAYHQTRSYLFLPLPQPPTPPTERQPVAALLTTSRQPVAGHTHPNPTSRVKNPNRQPLATLLTQLNRQPVAGHDPIGDYLTLLNNVEKLKHLLAQRGATPPPQPHPAPTPGSPQG